MIRPKNVRGEAGQTLLEILLAFGVSVLVLGAIVFGITASLNNAQYTKNQGLATSYAQEGMAVVRKIRDSSWSNFCLYGGGNYCLPQNAQNEATTIPKLTSYDSIPRNCSLNGVVGIFARKVEITHSSPECCSHDDDPLDPCPPPGACLLGGALGSKVTVTVSWTDGKCSVGAPYCHKVETTTCLSSVDLRQAP